MSLLRELMEHVSLFSLDKIPQLAQDERLIVFYKDDAQEYYSNRRVDIAASILELDTILTYTEREVDRVVKMKVMEVYTP
jgi:hypothetical protein